MALVSAKALVKTKIFFNCFILDGSGFMVVCLVKYRIWANHTHI